MSIASTITVLIKISHLCKFPANDLERTLLHTSTTALWNFHTQFWGILKCQLVLHLDKRNRIVAWMVHQNSIAVSAYKGFSEAGDLLGEELVKAQVDELLWCTGDGWQERNASQHAMLQMSLLRNYCIEVHHLIHLYLSCLYHKSHK